MKAFMPAFMLAFSIHFLFCNILISVLIGIILLAKKILGKHLSGCAQYHIWFLLPVILAIPFLSIRPTGFSQMRKWIYSMRAIFLPETNASVSHTVANLSTASDWLSDYRITVTRDSAPIAGYIPSVIWIGGMIVLTVLMIQSRFRLFRIDSRLSRSKTPPSKCCIRTARHNCESSGISLFTARHFFNHRFWLECFAPAFTSPSI